MKAALAAASDSFDLIQWKNYLFVAQDFTFHVGLNSMEKFPFRRYGFRATRRFVDIPALLALVFLRSPFRQSFSLLPIPIPSARFLSDPFRRFFRLCFSSGAAVAAGRGFFPAFSGIFRLESLRRVEDLIKSANYHLALKIRS